MRDPQMPDDWSSLQLLLDCCLPGSRCGVERPAAAMCGRAPLPPISSAEVAELLIPRTTALGVADTADTVPQMEAPHNDLAVLSLGEEC